MAQILQLRNETLSQCFTIPKDDKSREPKVGPGAAIGAGCVLVLIPVVQTASEAAKIWPRNPCLPF